jgi:hypothetical protein
VYDMYPWDNSGRAPARHAADRAPARHADDRAPARHAPGQAAQDPPAPQPSAPAQAVQAVQVALDRRDNGGDAVAAASQPTAGPTRQ